MTVDAFAPVAVEKTLMFVELVDSTWFAHSLGNAEAGKIFRQHDRMARDLLRRHGGVEMKKSDGFLMLFEDPVNAIRFALEYHQALAEMSRGLGTELCGRVGIHVGDVYFLENDAQDVALGAKPLEVEGLSVPFAARLTSLAGAQQILLSQTAYDMSRTNATLADHERERLQWIEHGYYMFKGVGDAVPVYEVGLTGFSPLEAPEDSEKVRRVGNGVPTIVVLPFENLSGDVEREYICDGLTDELISDLSIVGTLRVVSLTAALQLKSLRHDIEAIRKRLHAEFVLEGSVRLIGDVMRINVRMVSTISGELLWTDKHAGKLEDIFEIQENISRRVIDWLEVKLLPDEDRQLATPTIANLEAYEYYIRARQEIFKFSGDAVDRALQYLHKSAELVGDNLHVLSAIGYGHWQKINIDLSGDLENFKQARRCAKKCLALNPDAADGYRLDGLVDILEKKTQAGFAQLNLALEINPNDTDALFWLILMSGVVGKTHCTGPLLDRLLAIDPLTPLHHFLKGWIPFMEGSYTEAAKLINEARKMEPENPSMNLVYGQVLVMSGEIERGSKILTDLAGTSPANLFSGLARFLNAALSGEIDDPRSYVTESMTITANRDPEWSWTLAQCFSLAGDSDSAIDWLVVAVNTGFCNYPMLASRDPFLQNVRGEPRFHALMENTEKRWRAFEVDVTKP